MTSYIRNTVHYDGLEFALLSTAPRPLDSWLFLPEMIGLKATQAFGFRLNHYYCDFGLIDNKLNLLHISINLADENGKPTKGPKINNITPQKPEGMSKAQSWPDLIRKSTNNQYFNINHSLSFTGSVLLGEGLFNAPPDLHTSILASKSRVVELFFQLGHLQNSREWTQNIDKIRYKLKNNEDDRLPNMRANLQDLFEHRYSSYPFRASEG